MGASGGRRQDVIVKTMIASASTTQMTAHAVTKTQSSGVDLIPLQRRPEARSFLALARQYPSEMGRYRRVSAVGSGDVEAPAARPSPDCGLMRMACYGTPERTGAGAAVALVACRGLLLPLVRDAAAGRALRALAAGWDAPADRCRLEFLPGAGNLLVLRHPDPRRADAGDR